MTNHEQQQPNSSQGAETRALPFSLPDYALLALETLEGEGFESWVVGGYVRDALLGRPCSDIDIATVADWHDVQRVFEGQGFHTHETGTAHGTLTVIIHNQAIEVTTFRMDGAYKDARHPEHVTFVRSIEEDLARRDFTINALAYHPDRGLLDPFGGINDLRAQMICAVGNPSQRFAEDALRILRACRFVAQLGFSLSPDTYDGMLRNKGLLARISSERITHELSSLLLGDFAGHALMETVDVLAAVLPELVSLKGFEQHTPYHIYDVLEHTAHVLDGVPPYLLVRWAALFHDMGKPAAFFTDADGTGHFYDHATISVALARSVMARLTFSSAFSARVLTLVERHDDVIDPTPKAVKRMLTRLGGDTELFATLCDLKRGDARGQAPQCANRVHDVDELEQILAGILAADEAFSLKKLAIKGNDVISLGVEPGPQVGQALEAALDAVIDEAVPNEAGALQSFVTRWHAHHKPIRPDTNLETDL